MKAELKIALTALTVEEKAEVYTFLTPLVTPPSQDEDIPTDLLADLEKRLAAHRANPSGAITQEQFKRREFSVK